MRQIKPTAFVLGALALASAPGHARQAAQPSTVVTGVREAAWSPDGKRIAATWFDAIWVMAPDGRDAKRLVTKADGWVRERDPAWSPDGRSIAISVDSGDRFDLWVAPAGGGSPPRRVTTMPGDERWPSWTRDGRLVFSHRDPGAEWRLFTVRADGSGSPIKLTPDEASERQGRVSPDGKLIALVSDRETDADDSDLWVRELPADGATPASARAVRVTRTAGLEGYPTWSPDSGRLAFFARRGGQSAVWTAVVPAIGGQQADSTPAGRGAGAGTGGGRAAGAGRGRGGTAVPDAEATLASRHGGVPAWSPDGQTLLIATIPTTNAGYNGDPRRNDDDPPMTLAASSAYELWRVDAPRAVDANEKALTLPSPDPSRWTSAFDQVWQTLKSLYYSAGPSSAEWDRLRQKYRPQAEKVRDGAASEDVIDAMIAEQPLIKPALESPRAVVASGSVWASQAGAEILAKGGNVVDAGIAVSIALGVVEPDATSLGGDGQAILFLRGMSEPVVIEYKDMTPSHATLDNPKLFTPTGGRTAGDGPTVANIPGVAAGMDLLYQKYGSKKVQWADLVAPAIKLADEGFILDEALPTTIALGRAALSKYPEAAKLFMPGGKMPKPGDRFVNKDYAETLRILAREGASSFYRGTIAQKIVADMAANGGVITAEDLAQYRAMERQPLAGHYRNHLVYSVPAPVSDGARIVETLNILDNYQPKPGVSYRTDADLLHYVIEAWRVRDGGQRIADPEHWPVDLGNHLEPGHALERFKLIDPKKVYVAQTGGRGGGEAPGLSGLVGPESDALVGINRISTGTTAFVVADAEGNMIAFTQTLSTWGGNFYVSKGLGFLYNDHFRGGGGRGGGFGSMLPLQRSSSTSVPTLVFAPSTVDPGRYGIPGFVPRLAVGCAGNAWIPASVYDIITNIIDGGMSAQEAIEAPRLLIGTGNGGRSSVQIEDRLPRSLLAELESRGHSFTKIGRKGEVKFGYAALAVVNAAKGTVQAGADPRRSHGAAAPERK